MCGKSNLPGLSENEEKKRQQLEHKDEELARERSEKDQLKQLGDQQLRDLMLTNEELSRERMLKNFYKQLVDLDLCARKRRQGQAVQSKVIHALRSSRQNRAPLAKLDAKYLVCTITIAVAKL